MKCCTNSTGAIFTFNSYWNIVLLIIDCLEKLDDEIRLHQQGRKTESDVDTLRKIRRELLKMKEALFPKVFYPTYEIPYWTHPGEFSEVKWLK